MISAHIGFAIGMQEALDMDVLVHGEPERTDVVRGTSSFASGQDR
jgi:methionine synthase II (cobalamin-independent)